MSNSYNPLEGSNPNFVLNINDNSDEAVSIIIVHKDRPDYLNLTLQSIAVNSFNNNYEIIVVDNNSGQESQEFLNEIESDCKIVRNKENLYFSKAANIGAKHASPTSKYFIFLHCDVVILHPAWIDVLVNISFAGKAGVVGLQLDHYMLGTQKLDYISEHCLLVTRDAFNIIGGFPEEFPGVGSGFMFTMKAQNSNCKPQVMKDNKYVHHYQIMSTDINEHHMQENMARVAIPKALQQLNSRSI